MTSQWSGVIRGASGRMSRVGGLCRMALVPSGLVCAAVAVTSGLRPAPALAQSQSSDVRDRVSKATVMVITAVSKGTEGDTPMGSGSGFFINRTGLCISNNHVVDPTHLKPRWEKQLQAYSELNRLVWKVVVNGGTAEEKEYRGFVLYQNDRADQAILQVRDDDGSFLKTPHFLRLRPGSTVEPGLKAWCYGFPGGDKRKGEGKDAEHPTVAISEGHVVDMPRRPDGDLRMIICDVLVDPGNSGGPLVDVNGSLLGTATLKPPAEFAGRANQSALVPADLTREFVYLALLRGKLESGIDLEPFYTLLVDRNGYMDVPGLPRQESSDCIVLKSGLRVCGAPEGDSITLPTPLGQLTLPCAQMAYLLGQDDDRGVILMDGGQRVPYLRQQATLRFKPGSGDAYEQNLADVDAVVFRKGNELPEPPSAEKMFLLTGSEYHLNLFQVDGEAKFKTNLGFDMSLPLAKITEIERSPDDEQIVHTETGSAISGEFTDDTFNAVLAINHAPQQLNLKGVRELEVQVVEVGPSEKNRGVAEVLVNSTPDLVALARKFDEGEVVVARTGLNRFLESGYFNRQGSLRQDQIRLLDGVFCWAEGKYSEAARQFKKLKRSDDDGIKWYAEARLSVLDRYPDGTFESQPMSDPRVFAKAGALVAEEYVTRALEIITERTAPPPENRSMFMRLRKRFQKSSDELRIASRLDTPLADWAMMQVWNFEADTLYYELERLKQEKEEKEKSKGELEGKQTEFKGRKIQDEIDAIDKHGEVTAEWLGEVFVRLRDVGFIIDDPDIGIERKG